MSRVKKQTRQTISYMDAVPELCSYGFVVIPLDDKRPIFKRWNKLTHTPDKLYVFENKNLGVLTGQISGITVLDIDVKDDGLKIWNSLSLAYPEIITPVAKTPSGGLHFYFRFNKKLHSFSKFKLRGKSVGWDLLNNERQVVVPPSINMSTGSRYKWIASPKTVPFAAMPTWLEDYLMNAKSFR